MTRRRLGPGLTALIARAATRPRILVVLDFDGTLTPFRANPSRGRLSIARRATLARLQHAGLTVAVLSGRSRQDLKWQIGLPRVFYGGAFGLEMSGPGFRFVHPHARAARPALARLSRQAAGLFRPIPGALVENKGLGLGFHFGQVPSHWRRQFARTVAEARAVSPSDLEWTRSRWAWEVAPKAAWDKGRALLWLWRRLGRPFLIAIGDGPADEPMLRAARPRGAALRVGRGPSIAEHRLQGPPHVHRFLRALAAASHNAMEHRGVLRFRHIAPLEATEQ